MSYGPDFDPLRDLTEQDRADAMDPGKCGCCRRPLDGEPVTDPNDAGVRFCSEQCLIDFTTDERTTDIPVETMRDVVDGRLR